MRNLYLNFKIDMLSRTYTLNPSFPPIVQLAPSGLGVVKGNEAGGKASAKEEVSSDLINFLKAKAGE